MLEGFKRPESAQTRIIGFSQQKGKRMWKVCPFPWRTPEHLHFPLQSFLEAQADHHSKDVPVPEGFLSIHRPWARAASPCKHNAPTHICSFLRPAECLHCSQEALGIPSAARCSLSPSTAGVDRQSTCGVSACGQPIPVCLAASKLTECLRVGVLRDLQGLMQPPGASPVQMEGKYNHRLVSNLRLLLEIHQSRTETSDVIHSLSGTKLTFILCPDALWD